MGQPRFLHPGLIGLLLLAACGLDRDELLEVADVRAEVYSKAGAGSNYGPSSMDQSLRGTIRGTVFYTGKRRPRKLDISDDFCRGANPGALYSEDFLIGKGNTLGGVVVYVKRGLNQQSWPAPEAAAVLDQKGCRYIPHVLVVQTGQSIVIRNSDSIMHNVHGVSGANPEFNRAMSTVGELNPMSFTQMEVAKRIGCDVHGWMESWLAVIPHPCHALTAEDGAFEIRGVPPGNYLLAAWHEGLGEQTLEISVGNNAELNLDFTFPKQ